MNDPLAPKMGEAHALISSGSPASTPRLTAADSPHEESSPPQSAPPNGARPMRAPEQLLLPLAHIGGPEHLPPVGVTIEPKDRVYVNRDLNLAKIDWLGFDMDYTLAIYHQQALDDLSVRLTVERMIDRGYPRFLRHIRYDTRFPIRGLHVDKRYGNVLKMNRFKVVYKGYHGLARLKPAQIQELYVEKQVRPNTPRYHWIDTLFSLCEVTSYCAIVDALDKHGGRVDYGQVFDDVRKAIDEGFLPGPRMQVATLAVGATGGHNDLVGFSPYLKFGQFLGIADGEADIRKLVRLEIKNGADVIKLIAGAGVLSEEQSVGAPQYTEAEMAAAVDEAHMWGRRVAAHAHGAEAIKRAVLAGVTSIEHGTLIDDEGLRLMQTEGAEAIFARHEACAAASRAGLAALGFELFADERHYSRTVTAALVPDDLDWKAFNGALKDRGLVLAGGQGKLKGQIFRLGHLGSVTVEEILGALATLEAVSIEHGRTVEPGTAVAAAQRAALAAGGVFSMTVAGTPA